MKRIITYFNVLGINVKEFTDEEEFNKEIERLDACDILYHITIKN